MYHYTECGLPDVFIEGLETVVDGDGDEVIEIPFIAALHMAIAEGIVAQKGHMSGAELRFLRTELGMTQAALAEVAGVDHQTVGRWERGECPIGSSADTVIRRLVAEDLLKAFDSSIRDIAHAVASPADDDQRINIRAKEDGYDLAA